MPRSNFQNAAEAGGPQTDPDTLTREDKKPSLKDGEPRRLEADFRKKGAVQRKMSRYL